MKLCGLRIAAALSGFVFIYFSIYLYDVTAYNNETLFCMLISLWLLLFACRNGRKSILFAECFVLGLLPWVKLQFAPFTVCCLILSIARGVFVQQSRIPPGTGLYRTRRCHRRPDLNFSSKMAPDSERHPDGLSRCCCADHAHSCISCAERCLEVVLAFLYTCQHRARFHIFFRVSFRTSASNGTLCGYEPVLASGKHDTFVHSSGTGSPEKQSAQIISWKRLCNSAACIICADSIFRYHADNEHL